MKVDLGLKSIEMFFWAAVKGRTDLTARFCKTKGEQMIFGRSSEIICLEQRETKQPQPLDDAFFWPEKHARSLPFTQTQYVYIFI